MRPALRPADGQAAAWGLIGIVHGVVMEVSREVPIATGVRVLAQARSFGQLAAVGLAVGGAVALWGRFGARSRRAAYVAIGVVAAAIALCAVVPDLGGIEGRLSRGVGVWGARGVLAAATGVLITASAGVGEWLSSRGPWWGVAAGLGLATGNELVLAKDYPGVHLVIAAVAATLAGAAISTNQNAPHSHPWSRGARLSLAVLGAWAIVTSPPNDVARELFRLPGAVVAPVLARARFREEPARPDVPGDPWYSRTGRSDVAPTAPRLLPENAIVVLLVVDALRADVANGERGARTPAMDALRAGSVRFTRARSPASGTIWALATLFSGRYFSELRWTFRPAPLKDGYYPHEDPSTRFPEVMAKAGVSTVALTEMCDVLNEYGVVRGFGEERCLRTEQSPDAQAVVTAAIERLRRQGPGPMFLYLHFLETHAPYAGADVPEEGLAPSGEFQRYLRALEAVDRAIGRLRRAVESQGLADRVTFVLTGDHGEGFGEHGTVHHAVSVYEELLRVPLWISAPGVPPKEVAEDVSLVDLGPTLLDLFGLPTPGSFEGQSLVSRLRGESTPPLTRPLIAETGRFQQALVFPDQKKILRDRRRGIVEMYDLARDPGETEDLFESAPDAAERLERLSAYFGVHACRGKGYSTPYRP